MPFQIIHTRKKKKFKIRVGIKKATKCCFVHFFVKLFKELHCSNKKCSIFATFMKNFAVRRRLHRHTHSKIHEVRHLCFNPIACGIEIYCICNFKMCVHRFNVKWKEKEFSVLCLDINIYETFFMHMWFVSQLSFLFVSQLTCINIWKDKMVKEEEVNISETQKKYFKEWSHDRDTQHKKWSWRW